MVSLTWFVFTYLKTGYEVFGLQNIPDAGPALIIYYHGAIPIDLYYLIAHIYLEKGRAIKNVVDNFVFKLPGTAKYSSFVAQVLHEILLTHADSVHVSIKIILCVMCGEVNANIIHHKLTVFAVNFLVKKYRCTINCTIKDS